MPVSLSWQTWRATSLPVADSILRSKVSVTWSIPLRSRCKSHLPRLYTRSITIDRKRLAASGPNGEAIESNKTPDYVSEDIRERYEEIANSVADPYPRYVGNKTLRKSLSDYSVAFQYLKPKEESDEQLQVEGRIRSVRKAGKKLAFIDIAQEGEILQVLLNFGLLQRAGLQKTEFLELLKLLRRGDVISVQGYPHRTETMELSIRATQLPTILSPCLHPFPVQEISDEAAQETEKHVVMLASSEPINVLLYRSKIIQLVRDFFLQKNFLEVQTPILAAAAGGAVARPFETVATEFSDRKLNLRIAPELWLKRLIIGGMSRIFEIGPSFRNEGLDKTHNPEFTTCEFYQTYTTLPQLLSTTESLLSFIASGVSKHTGPEFLTSKLAKGANGVSASDFLDGPFTKVDFIPVINACLETELPNLSSSSARDDLLAIFKEKSIPVPPTNPTLPRLLDKLASTYLEPGCVRPTWIINIPECLSPLSKSFIHPEAPNNQPVAARAELFIHGKEMVNCYEEENSPWEQRRKFVMQQEYARNASSDTPHDHHPANLDNDYLRALEWGLPPTGGWGCGIDRLVMLFTGKERIGDVLSFGNLRRVTRGAEKWTDSEEADVNGQTLSVRK